MINIFTSTGAKLLNHPEVIRRIKTNKRSAPISLQVGPTSRCNLNCVFCSNANRTKHEDIDLDKIVKLMHTLRAKGLKTVEFTGGGEPTMYQYINELIREAAKIGLEQGMITNGILLSDKIEQKNLDLLKWVRVSINCLEYVQSIDLPVIKGTLGFSYVINEKRTTDVMERIGQHVDKYKPQYVRIVTNCLATDSEQEHNNQFYEKEVRRWGAPYFYQPKIFQRPSVCYWCYIKPFVLHDGYVYPCSSVVLNSQADGKFHSKYRWVKMGKLPEMYDKKMVPFPTDNCDHCVFKTQNDIIEMILKPEMGNFV